MSKLDEMIVFVATAPDCGDAGGRVAQLAMGLNGTVSWRYLTRFSQHGAKAGGAAPRSLPRTLIIEPPDWSTIDVLVVVCRGQMPLLVERLDLAVIEAWADDGPRMLIVEDLQRPAPTSPEDYREHTRIRAFVDRVAELPHVTARQMRAGEDFDDIVRQALAGIARMGWLGRYGIDRVVCRRCGFAAPVDRGIGFCPMDETVLAYPSALNSRMPPVYGPYPLNGVVGRGAFGRIFLSLTRHRGPGALKTLVDPSNAQSVARLRREFELLSEIEHDHIVRLYETCDVDGSPVGLMEYLSGRPLKFVLGAISPRHMLRFGMQLLSAVDAIHREGVIHRDLKPGNIMLVDDPQRPADPPRLVLLDFGLGKHQVRNLHENLTGTMLLGTPNYMAPEQFDTRNSVDGRADIYSIGVILYQGVSSGQRYPIPPLEDPGVPAEVLAFMQRVAQMDPRPLERPDVPQAIQDVIYRALARHASERFASAADMISALQAALTAWDAATPESMDRSWLDWRPPEQYVSTRNWGPNSDLDALTLVSNELPAASSSEVRHTARLEHSPELAAIRPPEPSPGPAVGHPVDPRRTPPKGRAPRWPAVIAGLVLAGLILGLIVNGLMETPPDDARLQIRVVDGQSLPVVGAGIVVSGQRLPGSTSDRGELVADVPDSDGGHWTVEVVPPRGYGVASQPVAFEADVFRDTAVHRVELRLNNPYHLNLPGGGTLPVALGDGSMRLLRKLRTNRLAWPDRPGVAVLGEGTEIFACGDATVPMAPQLPSPEQLSGFLTDCLASAEDMVVMRVRASGQPDPTDVELGVVQ